jgi:hypothetical protein
MPRVSNKICAWEVMPEILQIPGVIEITRVNILSFYETLLQALCADGCQYSGGFRRAGGHCVPLQSYYTHKLQTRNV